MIKRVIKSWTKNEIELLKQYRKQNIPLENYFNTFNRSIHAIEAKLNELGIKYEPKIKRWTNKELEIIKEMVLNKKTDDEIAKYFNKPIYCISSIRLRKLNLFSCNTNFWGNEEVETFKTLIKNELTAKEIAQKINRSLGAIYNKARELNLKIKEERKIWTDDELNLIKEKRNQGIELNKIKEQYFPEIPLLTLYAVCQKHKIYAMEIWTQEKINLLITLVKDNITIGKIKSNLKLGYRTIYRKVK